MQIPLTYALPLLIYSAVALRFGLLHREHINTDAVCYIRRAQYLLHGQWYYFISENWSLMISWLIAPLMALHIDGLYAARIVNGCIGGAFIVAFVSLAGRLLQIHWAWRLLAGAILAPFIAAVAMRAISPDLLLATWLKIGRAHV